MCCKSTWSRRRSFDEATAENSSLLSEAAIKTALHFQCFNGVGFPCVCLKWDMFSELRLALYFLGPPELALRWSPRRLRCYQCIRTCPQYGLQYRYRSVNNPSWNATLLLNRSFCASGRFERRLYPNSTGKGTKFPPPAPPFPDQTATTLNSMRKSSQQTYAQKPAQCDHHDSFRRQVPMTNRKPCGSL